MSRGTFISDMAGSTSLEKNGSLKFVTAQIDPERRVFLGSKVKIITGKRRPYPDRAEEELTKPCGINIRETCICLKA
jgi:hypothetical protein